MTQTEQKKCVAYVGSSHHIKKTKSTIFLIELLQEHYHVELLITDNWQQGEIPSDVHLDDRYHAVIFFQSMPQGVWKLPSKKNFIFAPMYDQSGEDPIENWIEYRDFKILCFSKVLGKKLSTLGFRTFSALYYPEPKPFPQPPESGTLFFWQRRVELDWPLVRKLIPPGYLKKVHLHLAMDLGEPVYPSENEKKTVQFTYSTWFENKDQVDVLIQNHELYVAPRLTEGIGFSFLEAMAQGAIVIAANNPTMNEYILHEQTGFLYNPKRPQPLDLTKISEIQQRLPEALKKGYQEWQLSRGALIQFIDEPLRPLGKAWVFTLVVAKIRLFLRALKRKVRSLF